MKKILHRADSRGYANHGWLEARHTFSFAGYYDPERVHFGMLRVLNDDIVAPARGFGMHPHDNMEIVTIPISGALQHRDSMGSSGVIRAGEVQIMSAGTGILHSEMNPSNDEAVNLLQIWVFPKQNNIKPRYDQKAFPAEGRANRIQYLVSPDQEEGALWINQDAWFSMTDLSEGHSITYNRYRENNGIYLFVLEGEVNVVNETLQRRDAVGVAATETLLIDAKSPAIILFIEVPMN